MALHAPALPHHLQTATQDGTLTSHYFCTLLTRISSQRLLCCSYFRYLVHKVTWCNGHYNRTPDLGKCVMWRDTWDLARHTILDTKVLDRNVTWLTKHKDTS